LYKITRPVIFSLIALAALLHLTVLGRAKLFGAKPDLLFSFVIFLGLFASREIALEGAIFAGLAKDLASCGPFGLNLMTHVFTGFLVSRISPHVYRESGFAQGLLTASFYVISGSAYYAFAFFGKASPALARDCIGSYPAFLFASIIPDAVYTGLVSVILFSRLMEYFEVSERLLL